MIDTTLMGPGFLVFFQRNIIESGGYPIDGPSDGFPAYRMPSRFEITCEEDEKVAPIVEDIALQAEATPHIESKEEIELILILRLEQAGILYKALYLEWILCEIAAQRKRNKEIALLLLLH